MNALGRLIKRVGTIGIIDSDSFALKRRKEFFNIVTILGALATIPQAITGFSFDFTAGMLHVIWGFACLISVVVHHYANFTLARAVTFIPVLVLGSIAAARLGHESYAHISSLTIFMGVFIVHDIKKEWGWILFYFLIECVLIVVIESNSWKSVNAPETATLGVRAGTLVGTVSFMAMEFIYFIRMGISNEQHVNRQLRDANLILSQRNEEKDLLIKEIHHRVKNNLQIVSSLLRLQSHEIEDENAKEKFLDSINRVKSISNLHEMIYRSDNLFDINMNAYLKNLANSLIKSYSIDAAIELEIHSELKKVQNDHIVPISLILNEMILNSLKHGFSEGDHGKISVSIVQLEEKNHYRLVYSDSGSWVPSTQLDSFGIELIQSLVDQLNGIIEREPDAEKSEYSIVFEVIESDRA